jgi:hypothetical protein
LSSLTIEFSVSQGFGKTAGDEAIDLDYESWDQSAATWQLRSNLLFRSNLL